MQLWPHAYVIMTADKVGVLVHLGLDTVQLKGEGFTTHASEGDKVEAGQTIITYDVPAVEAAGRNPVIPVVVMGKKQGRYRRSPTPSSVASCPRSTPSTAPAEAAAHGQPTR